MQSIRRTTYTVVPFCHFLVAALFTFIGPFSLTTTSSATPSIRPTRFALCLFIYSNFIAFRWPLKWGGGRDRLSAAAAAAAVTNGWTRPTCCCNGAKPAYTLHISRIITDQQKQPRPTRRVVAHWEHQRGASPLQAGFSLPPLHRRFNYSRPWWGGTGLVFRGKQLRLMIYLLT